MAVISLNFASKALATNTNINVVFPINISTELSASNNYKEMYKPKIYKVLYLLHGAYSDGSDWLRRTNIERYVEDKDIIVVMPSVGNSFYSDSRTGSKYWIYITEELPSFLKMILPISDKREDTFIAGLSMGGYGAMKYALQYPQKFAAAASMSGVLDIVMAAPLLEKMGISLKEKFGSIESLKDSDKDLLILLKNRVESSSDLPRLFQCVGTDDFLYQVNLNFKSLALDLGLEITYEEGIGDHDWNYWDINIKRIIEWFGI